ncbi:PulJ/GspJ family protein [uncultured Aquimarina sp.]|uniref:PulJ/GspJ family protein n=1 Tax=uncultured Aquimarina sp. TaxID=575652 RepID=UPI00261790A1|nr:type II secretion system protein [uncultured Aquimarina sp.]
MNTSAHKIKAFTLTEMMVVLVITAIVVGLAFSVLSLVQKNMRSIENNYEYQSQIRSLEVALTIDFNKYTSIHWNAKENILSLSSPNKENRYIFTKDSVYNNQDTFRLQIKDIQYFFEGKKVNSGSIDAVKLKYMKASDVHSTFVYKYNDPTIYF